MEKVLSSNIFIPIPRTLSSSTCCFLPTATLSVLVCMQVQVWAWDARNTAEISSTTRPARASEKDGRDWAKRREPCCLLLRGVRRPAGNGRPHACLRQPLAADWGLRLRAWPRRKDINHITARHTTNKTTSLLLHPSHTINIFTFDQSQICSILIINIK